MPIRSGKYRHKVEIQKQSTSATQDAVYGDEAPSWAKHTDIQVAAIPLSGRERFEAEQVYGSVDYRFEARWRNTHISPEHRVSWNGRVFDIKASINVDEMNQEIHIFATEEGTT